MSETIQHTPSEMQNANEAYAALTETFKKFADNSITKSEYDASLNKIKDGLSEYNIKNNEITKQLAGAKDENEALSKRLDDLDRRAFSLKQTGVAEGSNVERSKFFYKFFNRGFETMTVDERSKYDSYLSSGYGNNYKYLRTDDNPQGGYLVFAEEANSILKRCQDVSDIRKVARVITSSSKMIEWPKLTERPVATWIGEGQLVPNTQQVYGLETITNHGMKTLTPISIEMGGDSAFDMANEISADIGAAFAKTEGTAFVVGDGSNKPQGLLSNGDVGIYATGDSTNAQPISYKSLVRFKATLKVCYQSEATWIFNQNTLADIQLMADNENRPLWQINAVPGAPATILGRPWMLAQDMEDTLDGNGDVIVGNAPIIYGDFRQAYLIVDRLGMFVIRDNLTSLQNGLINWFFMKRVGGQVILADAMKKMLLSTS